MDQQHTARPPASDGPRDAAPSGTDLAEAVLGDAGSAGPKHRAGSGAADPHRPGSGVPATHRPRRPEWGCQACRQAWPCQEGKRELLAEYADDRVGLLVYLAGLLVDAVQDIDAPPNLLLDRFLRWAKIGEVP